jgi:hypothetical protein
MRKPSGGVVEVDGAFFGGHVKPTNHAKNRKDLRLAENQTGKRRCVVVMRERAGRVLPFVVPAEDAGAPLVEQMVEKGSTIHADEAPHWDRFHVRFDTKRITHSKAYSEGGACTNQAESFFSRMRRSEIGVHHRISGKYLDAYANESAWRENNRRISNGPQFNLLIGLAAKMPPSARWAGYWQRRVKRPPPVGPADESSTTA